MLRTKDFSGGYSTFIGQLSKMIHDRDKTSEVFKFWKVGRC